MKFGYTILLSLLGLGATAQKAALLPPLPTPRQLNWQEQEFYLFTHFGPNTFTDLEWGHGTEHEEVFNPTELDCRQWARIAKAAGAKGIIITAKHHDGFCLWPSKYSKHTVRESKWKDGKGDVLKELSDACKAYGLKLGIYLSPWDRNHPQYGTPGYNDVFVDMMKEVVSRYGPLFEFWWDGANGEGPNGKKMVYDWHRFEQTMRTIAPNTPVFSDIGPDMRWVGNEKGIAGKTNWNLLDTAGFNRGLGAPSTDTLNSGNFNGKVWIPAECDVSIRPGWFYHQTEDAKVKTPEELFDLYLKSVGRGANFLLNVPPDRRGLFTSYDSASLVGFRKLLDENLSKPVASKTWKAVQQTNNTFSVALPKSTAVNCVLLQEPIELGQRVISFSVQLKKNGSVVKEISATTIGRKRILTFPAEEADAVDIVIKNAKATPYLKQIAVYKIADNLVEKE
ncbi:alpha-L-fucosidase [Danxiaibacter flavus]|uniref:alpha-L-fucosidase n=1 Tax=Danxiaibacter flavus TaxID=3049108 RepID=A0ABV3ZIM6_9BACT|nr:alpha-L-fucosidase [Chitinophagaceae bacterium DXS]